MVDLVPQKQTVLDSMLDCGIFIEFYLIGRFVVGPIVGYYLTGVMI